MLVGALKGGAEEKRPRFVAIDMARGLAIIGVVIYHFCWDLRYFGFLPVGIEDTPLWLISQRVLLGSFMVLTGASLVLAHQDGVRWRAFWSRFGILAIAAAAVSLGTFILFPEAFVYFGVLHAIALFSLMAVPFLRVPLGGVGLVALGFIATALVYQSSVFNVPALAWIGFFTVPPLTNDLVPIFPWFGFVLVGVVGMRGLLARGWQQTPDRVHARDAWSKTLVWAGRWSLVIYLVHQPILIGVLTPAANIFQPGAEQRAIEFVGSCQQSCELGSGEARYCQRYCACSLEQIEAGNLWDLVTTPSPGLEQSKQVATLANLCAAMAQE